MWCAYCRLTEAEQRLIRVAQRVDAQHVTVSQHQAVIGAARLLTLAANDAEAQANYETRSAA
ncbi:hypothetical protein GCM10009687_28110 [Asanoa iriomotensis]|uniref:ANTAR domain-containing protein n=1 Tax=Asanoa iriomotensis TaxID=234613 RepID=A0ABQ4CBS8_9ACTN|nr:hypothetical protein Air01nite_63250 [Asanoa iriomotensis]